MNTQPLFATAFRSRFAMRRSFTAPDSADAKIRHTATSRVAVRAMKLLLPGLLLIAVSPARADHTEKHFKVEARPVITLHNPNGTVVVKAWTKPEVMVIATRATDQVEVDADADRKPRRYHDPPSLRRRGHRFGRFAGRL